MVKVTQPTLQHCKDLAPRLRPQDIVEITVVSPDLELQEILEICVETSTDTYAVVDDEDGCVALFGVRDVDEESGIPWFLSCDLFFSKHKRRFIKETPEYLEKLFGNKQYLYNYVSKENKVSQRWLKSLGFNVLTNNPIKFRDVVFYPFEKRKELCVES